MRREAHAVGGGQGHAKRLRQLRQRRVVRLLVAQQVPLHVHVHAAAAEDADQPVQQPPHPVVLRVEERPTGQRHQTRRITVKLLHQQRALPFRGAHLHLRDQTTQMPVALGGGHQHGQPPAVRRRAGRATRGFDG
jgi:hypothetical protein